MNVVEKFDSLARGYSEHDYGDPERYSRRRAQLVLQLGRPLPPGASVLDLGCGDGIMAAPLLASGLAYRGVDASAAMVEAARERNPGVEFEVASLDTYEPDDPVECTLCLRAFYYAPDRRAFFARVRSYTRTKFVLDFRPKVHPADELVADLRAVGFTRIELRPFLLPQRRRLHAPARTAVALLERTPLAPLVLRVYGRMLCSAS